MTISTPLVSKEVPLVKDKTCTQQSSHSTLGEPLCDVPEFWATYQDRLFKYILKRTKDEDTAKDIQQTVLLKVYEFCLRQTGVKKPASWLYQIAHNTIIDHYRRQARLSYKMPVLEEAPYKEDTVQDAANCIRPLLKGLPNKYAEALTLADLEGYSQQKVADHLGISLSGAKSRIQRARQKLKDLFLRCCKVEFDHRGKIIDFYPKANCDLFQGNCG